MKEKLIKDLKSELYDLNESFDYYLERFDKGYLSIYEERILHDKKIEIMTLEKILERVEKLNDNN